MQIAKIAIQAAWIEKVQKVKIQRGDIKAFYIKMLKAHPILNENPVENKPETPYTTFTKWLAEAEFVSGISRQK